MIRSIWKSKASVGRWAMLISAAIIMPGATLITKVHAEQPEPFLTTTDLFEAGQAAYTTYRAPTILTSPAGTLIVSTEARKDGFGDWANIDTIIRRSADGGETWEDPLVVVDDGLNAVNNNAFVVDHEKERMHLMHAINYERVYWRTSTNDGKRWSAPRDITEVFETYRSRDDYPWTVVAPGMSPGIVLQSGPHQGRFVVPVWLALEHRHRPSLITTVYSDDRGETWHAGDVIARDSEWLPNPSETVLMELSDGRVMMHIRNESSRYRRAVAFSPDGATNWNKPEFDEQLYDPICQASLLRYSGNQLIFSNPDSSATQEQALAWNARRRENLTIRLSNDDGKTWSVSRVLEPGFAGYSQLTKDDDDNIYCVFERGNIYEQHGKFAPNYVSVAKIKLAWLLEGRSEQ